MNSFGLFKHISSLRLQYKRFRYKKKWAINNIEKNNSDHALNYFDVFYEPIFHNDWRSIRLALLSRAKYCTLLNNFSEIGSDSMNIEITGQMDEKNLNILFGENVVDECFEFLHSCIYDKESNKYSLNKINKNEDIKNSMENPDLPTEHSPVTQILSETDKLKIKEHELLNLKFKNSNIEIVPPLNSEFIAPRMLKALIQHEGNTNQFPPSKLDKKSGKLMYYLMDASSILPVLCLDLFPRCSILDMCSAPGGKMLAICQTMLPEKIVCLEKSYTRMQRLKEIVWSYLPKLYFKENIIETHVCDALDYSQQFSNQFDRVLVDVPCFSDRHVLTEENSNLFVPNRRSDRLEMPSVQLELLKNGINSCKTNGVIVYSTCTLSLSQNDAIVAQAIDHFRTNKIRIVVEDTGCIARSYEHVFKFSLSTSYGQLVLPNMTKNFGPMYFSKLRKLS